MLLDCVCVVFSQLTITSESAMVFKKRSAKQCDITVLLIKTHDIDKFPKNRKSRPGGHYSPASQALRSFLIHVSSEFLVFKFHCPY